MSKWENSLKDKLPKWDQDAIVNLNSHITIKETEFIKYKTKKTPDCNVFNGEFYQIFYKDTVSILYKLFQKKRR